MKRNEKKTLKNKLDRLWSEAIRKKYIRCIVCGRQPTQAHHCIVRKAQSLGVRWMIDNGVGLCYVCHIHRLHGSQGDKQWLDRYITVLNGIIPEEKQQNIIEIGNQINKFSVEDLKELVRHFEAIK